MADFTPIIPACWLTLGILGVLVADLLTKGRRPGVSISIALLALATATLSALDLTASDDVVLGGLRVDDFSIVFTVFCCVVGFLSIIATMRGEAFRRPGGEFLMLILSAVLGMSLLSMSVDLIFLYLAFETVSIPSYVLVGMRRADFKANEASIKYVLFGAVSSGLMLYGISFIVGLSGGTSLDAIGAALQNGAADQPIFVIASVLIFAGFAFKISAVPFHFWAPDVYAGAPASVGGFLAVASKAAGFAALVRVVGATVPNVPDADIGTILPDANPLITVLAVSAILTMTFGNLAALRQREIKRLLAWSSIAHAGYIMLAISIWSVDAIAALLLYLVAYLFMNIAAFFIAGLAIRELGTGELSAFRGLMKRNVGLTIALCVIMFSLTGLPPFFGFIAKLQIFYAVFAKGYVWLGVIGLINGVISLYYYANIVKLMVLTDVEEGEPEPQVRMALVDRVFCGALVAPLLVFGIFWDQIWTWAQGAVPALFGG